MVSLERIIRENIFIFYFFLWLICPYFFSYFLACSLAIHPDKVRVASGQTAGVDKDGKVNKSQSTD